MGHFNNNITNMVNTVYAINRAPSWWGATWRKADGAVQILFSGGMNPASLGLVGFISSSLCPPSHTAVSGEGLDHNYVDTDEETLEETRILLPGTITVEDIR
jgi:hypothetical protein